MPPTGPPSVPLPLVRGPALDSDARARATRPPAIPGPDDIPTGVSARLAQLLAGPVEALWSDVAAAGGPPLVEDDGDQRLLTFLWRGADASSVVLFANKRFDRANPQRTALQRAEGTDVWALTLRVPADWQASYQFLVDGGPAVGDPLNPHVARQGRAQKGVVDLTGTYLTPATAPGLAVPLAVPHELAGPLGPVTVWTVDPPAGAPAAEIVVLDGRMWVEELDLAPRLHHAAALGSAPPVRLVLVDTGPEPHRTALLSCRDEMAVFLADAVAGLADVAFGGPPPNGRYLAGSSLSGLQAVFTALAFPQVFAGALSQSGSFWWPSAELDPEWLTRSLPAGRQRYCIQDGTDEWVNTGPTARLQDALRGAGHSVVDTTVAGGHDRIWWAARFADGVADLLAT